MSDRVALPLPSGNVQTRVFRSNSFNPPPPLGCHRSRRTLSLPSREKPLIPPVISENPECSREETEQYRQELLTSPQPQQPQILINCCDHEVGWLSPVLGLLISILLYIWACLLSISVHDKDTFAV